MVYNAQGQKQVTSFVNRDSIEQTLKHHNSFDTKIDPSLSRKDQFLSVVMKLESLKTKTKEMLDAPRALIVTKEVDENLYLAARNIPHVNVLGTNEVDPVSLIAFDKVIMSVEAAKQFEEALA